VHYHAGTYDFIGHDGKIVHTSKSLDDYKLMLQKPQIQNLIVGSRVVVRFKGAKQGGGLGLPDEVVQVLAELAGIGVTRQDFDYTND